MQENPQAEEGGADTMGQTDRLNAPPQASGVILRYLRPYLRDMHSR